MTEPECPAVSGERRRRDRGTQTGTTMKRKRWTARLVGGALVFAGLGGCERQLYLEPGDYQGALSNGMVARLETQPHEQVMPSPPIPATPPATILDPDRPPRPLTLKEAIAIAMEQGTTGQG